MAHKTFVAILANDSKLWRGKRMLSGKLYIFRFETFVIPGKSHKTNKILFKIKNQPNSGKMDEVHSIMKSKWLQDTNRLFLIIRQCKCN